METWRIDIVNPKAKRIIQGLADLRLITIKNTDTIRSFDYLLKKLRAKKSISLENITNEVEKARSKRYAKKG